MPENPLSAFGRWLAETPNEWPADARHSAHRELIDLIAVMVPGAAEDVTRHVSGVVSGWGDGPCACVGQTRRMAAPWAALVNGTAGHVLDLDDNFDPPKAHATTVLGPAIFALGDQEGASGDAIIDAYICGLQIMGRVGQGVNPTHRNRGWHATATVGAVGAAAACARLLGLDAQKAAYALSLSTSMAAGFMSQFGTMAKPVHAGLAAKAGIMAASLAQAGVTAGMGTLDGRTGMNRLMVGPDYEELRDGLTHVEHGQNLRYETAHVGQPLLITEHGFRVKRFANCGAAHRAMDGLLEIRAERGLKPADVERIDVYAPRVHFNNLMYQDPQSGLESKFSIEYPLAVILAGGDCSLDDFTDQGAARPAIRALYPLIRRCPVDKLEGEFPTRVEVIMKDGRRFEKTKAMPLGSKAAPFTDAQYWEKYATCVAGHLSGPQAEALRQAAADLPHLAAIGDLTRHLAVELAS